MVPDPDPGRLTLRARACLPRCTAGCCARCNPEEAGCDLVGAVRLGQIVRAMPEGWTNRIELVAGRISGTPRADGREILEVGLFALAALPPETSTAVHDYVAQLQSSPGLDRGFRFSVRTEL